MLLPAALLREVDELVLQGRGGYQTRQEFILDAVQNQVLEVKYGAAENKQRPAVPEVDETPVDSSRDGFREKPKTTGAEDTRPAPPPALSNGEPVEPIRDVSATELHLDQRGVAVEDGLAVVKEEPVLGLHNRDYPSIWAAHLLAEETRDGLVPFTEFLDRATRQAWRYAESLAELEKESKVKLRALYPTNFAKPQSSEEGFRAFAIGSIAKTPRGDGKVDASGPLFSWGVSQVIREGGQLMVGVTPGGYNLLEDLDGLSLRWPHEAEYAERFFAYLRAHAPWEWAGFEQLLEAVAESPTRVELAQHFKRWHPDWSDAMANTNAAGFVARSREWGLLESKLVDGRYALTEFGEIKRTGARV